MSLKYISKAMTTHILTENFVTDEAASLDNEAHAIVRGRDPTELYCIRGSGLAKFCEHQNQDHIWDHASPVATKK